MAWLLNQREAFGVLPQEGQGWLSYYAASEFSPEHGCWQQDVLYALRAAEANLHPPSGSFPAKDVDAVGLLAGPERRQPSPGYPAALQLRLPHAGQVASNHGGSHTCGASAVSGSL
mmetsp:Transcript_15770/g.37070  ORF Transcript_15770/g.37070 Transcript_15770/m.37070 type:complete len:116 (-) Transcript_15770:116-463(-)